MKSSQSGSFLIGQGFPYDVFSMLIGELTSRINFNFTSYFPFALSRKICMYQQQRQLGVRNLQILQT